jgi:AhpD family alkylhydroperoxidase
LVRPNVSFALREKIFLAVTSINDYRYCQWGHSHWAMAHGVPLEEVNQILRHQTESLEARNPAEAAAILFALHYAEQLDQFDPESIENLRRYYSDVQVNEILAYVRFITFTNIVRGDVGGFGIGSDLTWNLVGTFQYYLSRAVSLDVGYRAFDIDYDQGSGATLFKFDVLMHGPRLGVVFRF